MLYPTELQARREFTLHRTARGRERRAQHRVPQPTCIIAWKGPRTSRIWSGRWGRKVADRAPLVATLGFRLLEPHARELRLLHQWLAAASRMTRQDFAVHLTRSDGRRSTADVPVSRMEQSRTQRATARHRQILSATRLIGDHGSMKSGGHPASFSHPEELPRWPTCYRPRSRSGCWRLTPP